MSKQVTIEDHNATGTKIAPEYWKSFGAMVRMGCKKLRYISNISDLIQYCWASALVIIAFMLPQGLRQKLLNHRNRTVHMSLFRNMAMRLMSIANHSEKICKLNDILLPISDNPNWMSYITLINDTFGAYLYNENRYDEAFYEKWDKVAIENLNCLQIDDWFDCTVQQGDAVLDLGAYIGDFSVLAASMGAKVYAFEPTPESILMIEKTNELNKTNIEIVPYGTSDATGELSFVSGGSAEGNFFLDDGSADDIDDKVKVVSLDDWCAENNVKPDFIKADIEGFERRMLKGARYILKTYAPKLCICTYHLPDDPQVLRELILKANPDYRIVQKRRKLYAVVREHRPA